MKNSHWSVRVKRYSNWFVEVIITTFILQVFFVMAMFTVITMHLRVQSASCKC